MNNVVAVRKLVSATLVCAGLAVLVVAGTVMATPGSGVQSTVFAVGAFDEFEAKTETDTHGVELKTKGVTDVHILENRIVPGGTFGWHSHPGPSIVVVKSGALTLYRADDPACTAHVFAVGSGFIDHGGDVHVVRNEGSVDAVVYVTSLVPKGAERRIDEPSPGHCAF